MLQLAKKTTVAENNLGSDNHKLDQIDINEIILNKQKAILEERRNFMKQIEPFGEVGWTE